MNLQPGMVALVTGASRGLGAEIARALAAQGCDLMLVARSAEGLEQTATNIAATSKVRVTTLVCDLSDPAAITELAAKADAVSAIDIVVNNAGAEQARAYDARTPASIIGDIAINLQAPMLLTHALLPGMIARGRGHIVNIASTSGLIAMPYQEPYSATKFGLVGFSRALRLTSHMEGWGIGVSAVCPGFVADDGMFARIMAEHGLDAAAFQPASLAAVGQAVVTAVADDHELVCVDGGGTPEAVGFSYADPAAFGTFLASSEPAKLFRMLAKC